MLLIILFLLLSGPASAMGWYSQECCNNKDCRQVQKGEVAKLENGWWVPKHKTLIPFDSGILKPSLDANMHICQNSLRVICLYIPDPGI